jgi:hypothetical protein
LHDDIVVKIYDEDVTDDDFVGMGSYKASSLMINNGVNDWFNITYKEK